MKTLITARRILRPPLRSPTPSVVSDVVGTPPTTDIADIVDVASDGDEYSSMSDSSTKRLRGEPKRGRGRPETTGEYRVKKAMMAEKEIRKEIEDLETVLDPEVDPLRFGKRPDKQTEEMIERMSVTPTPDLAAILNERIAEVQNVAERSRNLKRIYVKLINNATDSMHAAARELFVRAQLGVPEQAEEEMTVLRRETASLRNENRHLQKEMEAIRKKLRDLEAASPTVPATRTARGRSPSPLPPQ